MLDDHRSVVEKEKEEVKEKEEEGNHFPCPPASPPLPSVIRIGFEGVS